MPELPEVETVRRTLLPQVQGTRVTGVWTSGKPLRMNRPLDLRRLRALVGLRFLDARRAAKYLLLDLDRGAELVVHLGMSGRLHVSPAAVARPPHTHVAFALDDGRELRYVDPRRFGTVMPFPGGGAETWSEIAKLGVDPLSPEFTAERLAELARRSKRPLKAFLLDQTVIAGLGNIYVCEALWHARLHPFKRADRLTRAEATRLCAAIVKVLERAIERRGTTLRDYVDANGEIGFNQLRLRVYGKAGETCFRCKDSVIRGVMSQGRGTFYCPKCQSR